MTDLHDKISFSMWKDPATESPTTERQVVTYHGGTSLDILRHFPATGRWARFRQIKRPWFEPAPIAWTDLPDPARAVSREDIETVLDAAQWFSPSSGPEARAAYEAAARIRAALGDSDG